jgi:hypothetical protein
MVSLPLSLLDDDAEEEEERLYLLSWSGRLLWSPSLSMRFRSQIRPLLLLLLLFLLLLFLFLLLQPQRRQVHAT